MVNNNYFYILLFSLKDMVVNIVQKHFIEEKYVWTFFVVFFIFGAIMFNSQGASISAFVANLGMRGTDEVNGSDSQAISFMYPTPIDGAIQGADSVYVNASVENVDTAFVDWQDSLTAWWKFDDDTDWNSYTDNDLKSSFSGEDDGAWCWFGDPRAVHYNGNTYVSWVNRKGDLIVWKYDHATEQTETSVLIENFEIDDHANPSILINPDGRLMVFYSEHAGYSAIKYKISTNPEDISSWGEQQQASPIGSYTGYPNPVYLSEENKTYVFYRGNQNKGWDPTYVVYDGINWSNETKVFEVEPTIPRKRPYTKIVSNGIDEIHLAFTYGHPDGTPENNIYYTSYKNNSYYLPNGIKIKDTEDLPLYPGEVSLVYDANITGERAWIWDIALDTNENPYLVYAIVEDIENHYYVYSWWNNETNSWINNYITDAGPGIIKTGVQPYYSGGVVLDHENPNVVYLSKKVDGIFEIQKAETFDGGLTWNFEDITSNSDKDNLRPVAIRDHTEDFKLAWFYGDYLSFRDYPTQIVSDKMSISSKNVEVDSGKYLNSFSFDGEHDYVVVSDNDVLDGMDELTVEMWIKVPDNGEYKNTFISKWGADYTLFPYELSYYPGLSQLEWKVITTSGSATSYSSANIAANKWQHIVGVYDGTKLVTYLNGQELASKPTLSGKVLDSEGVLFIGAHPLLADYGVKDHYLGKLDEVRIHSRAFSAEEVRSSYGAWSYGLAASFNDLLQDTYFYKVYMQDVFGSFSVSDERSVRIEVDIFYDDFDGETTDLSPQSVSLSEINNFVLEKSEHGKIEFLEATDLSQGGNLNDDVEISNNHISIDTNALPGLDVSARLTLIDLDFNKPLIMKGNSVCLGCTMIIYSSDHGTATFEVPSFGGDYWIKEKPKKPRPISIIMKPFSSQKESLGEVKPIEEPIGEEIIEEEVISEEPLKSLEKEPVLVLVGRSIWHFLSNLKD